MLLYARGRLSCKFSRVFTFDFVALKFPIIYLYCSTDIPIYSVFIVQPLRKFTRVQIKNIKLNVRGGVEGKSKHISEVEMGHNNLGYE